MDASAIQMRYLSEQVARHYAARPEIIERLLLHMGAQFIQRVGNEIRCTCPIHHGNNREAFVVWTDRGFPIWRCYTHCYATGGIIKLVQKKYQCTFEQAVMWAAQFAGIMVDPSGIQISREILDEGEIYAFKRKMGQYGNREDQMNVFPEDMVNAGLNVLARDPVAHSALDFLLGPANEITAFGEKKKQYPWEILQYFQVGFIPGSTWVWPNPDPNSQFQMQGWFEDRISIPWRNLNGECCGFSGRRIDGVPIKKYKVLPGTSRALAIYGLSDRLCLEMIAQTKTFHLLEGFGDRWRAHQHRCYNSGANGGTEMTSQQIGLMRQVGVQKVVIFYDGDDAGRISAARLAKQLYLTFRVEIAFAPPKIDPGDLLTSEDFWSPIQRAIPFIPGMF